jgi:hypothetical protein
VILSWLAEHMKILVRRKAGKTEKRIEGNPFKRING